MRLRNVKNKKTILDESRYLVKSYENYRGKWKKLFKNTNDLHLEIGVGKGKFIFESALKNPQFNYIGIEKSASILAIAIKKYHDIDLPNLKLICADAKEVDRIFKREIDTLYLNFSDPWPKKRHQSRRLTSPIFLSLYSQIFAKTKKIILKTDNRQFFEYSLENLSSHNYIIEKISLDLDHSDFPNEVTTDYEEKFKKENKLIYLLIARQ